MLAVRRTNRFNKSMKLAVKRGKNISKIEAVVALLQTGEPLPEKHKDHPLIGNYAGTRECRMEPDWLLIYRIEGTELILIDTGTHSDLF